MGSEAVRPPSPVEFHLTGFKKFYNVPENPTEVLMMRLKKFMEGRALPSGATIGSCNILETAGAGGLKFLLDLLDSKSDSKSNSKSTISQNLGHPLGELEAVQKNFEGPRQVVWVHFGVDSGAGRFKIEKRAVNEATFRCPDEMGWQPVEEPIAAEDGPVSRIRETVLPTSEIVAELTKQGFDAVVSRDAGLFVCNYVYYQSLRHAANHGTKSIFAHVPPFSVIDEKTQLEFVATLLKVLASILV